MVLLWNKNEWRKLRKKSVNLYLFSEIQIFLENTWYGGNCNYQEKNRAVDSL